MKKALLIANQNYDNLEKLNLCINDANALETIFVNIGFEVKKYTNLNYEEMMNVVTELKEWVKNRDEILVFFTGHGYSFDYNNYITCKDSLQSSKLKSIDMFEKGYDEAVKVVPISTLMNALEHNKEGINILLFDACRNVFKNEHFEDSHLKKKPCSNFLEPQKIKENFFISYSTTLGKLSYENSNKENSEYVKALLQYILIKDITLTEIFECVKNYMFYNSKEQIPVSFSSLRDSYKLIDNSISNPEVELFNIKAKVELFEFLNAEINTIEDTQNREEVKLQLKKSIEGMETFPKRIINLFIDKVIISFEEKCGLIYILLEENDIQIVDVRENEICIEDKTGKKHKFDNKDLYDFDDSIAFLNNYQKTSDFSNMLNFSYKNKPILMPAFKSDKYFQIGIKTTYNEIKNYIKDKEIKNITYIEEILNQALRNRENILVIGTPYVNKEGFITSISERFKESEKILIINSGITIKCKRGIIESSSWKEIIEYSDEDIQKKLPNLKEQKTDIIILPYKVFHRNDNNNDNDFKKITEKITGFMKPVGQQLIMLQDLDPTVVFGEKMLEDIADFTEYIIPSIKHVNLIFILDKDKNGSYINSIYKENEYNKKAMDVLYKIDI